MKPQAAALLFLASASLAACCGEAALANEFAAPNTQLRAALYGGERCEHVMRLMARAASGESQQQPIAHPGGFEIRPQDMGDLRIAGVTCDQDFRADAPPIYHVMIANDSPREVTDVPITIVGIVGRIRPTDPSTTVRVSKIGAGECVEVRLRMPVESLTMLIGAGQLTAFNKLVVAVDSMDSYAESDESNNIAVYDRVEVPIAAAAAGPQEEVSASAPTVGLPADSAEPRPSQGPLDSAFEEFEKDSRKAEDATT